MAGLDANDFYFNSFPDNNYIDGKLIKYYYNYNNTVFLFTDDNPGFIMEQKFKLQWNINNKWAMKAGTLFTYGDYPFGKGNAWYPIVDILYGF